MKRRLTLAGLAAAIAFASCARQAKHPPKAPTPVATRPAGTGRPSAPPASASAPRAASAPLPTQVAGKPVRIALAAHADVILVGATGDWKLYDQDGANEVASGDARKQVRYAPFGAAKLMWASAADGMSSPVGGALAAGDGPYVLRATNPSDLVVYAGKRYRGELVLVPNATDGAVVNRVGVEEYLRGVVPIEIGDLPPADDAATQAQAVAARSYAYTHLAPARTYDMVATVTDQAYGGVGAERASGDRAVQATAGMVLTYGGRVISAPYHSTCGGQTAAASEVWQGASDEPYLRPVSDRVSGSDRFYCDGSPRFTWTRTIDPASLDAAVARYLRDYAPVPDGGPGIVRSVRTDGATATGRTAAVIIGTSRGSYALRGNAMRYVLRTSGGEILNSTYFTVDPQSLRGGAPLTLRGRGYGHGIGMCQWGAIGRARAGQDVSTILSTYYPGTRVERVD